MHWALLDVPRSGAENMAIDQAMLDQASLDGGCLLRIYEWSQPTLSLGYFQKYAERHEHPESAELDVVRRKTGGGAIVHHHDWTYSIAVPEGYLASPANPSRKTQTGAAQPLYYSVHEALVQWLAELRITAQCWEEGATCDSGRQVEAGCSFLCFERRSQGDVVAGGCKLVGSAQRRQRGAVLQHGSLLLRRSEFAPSLPGTSELARDPSGGDGGSAERRVFFGRVKYAVENFLGVNLQVASSLPRMLDSPIDVAAFSSDNWLRKR